MSDEACAVRHTDSQGRVIPCPGYPHTDLPVQSERPRASTVEIIAKNYQPTEDGGGSLIVPNEIRINGVSVYTPRGTVVKIGDVQLGDNLVSVNITLAVRRLVIAADGDLDRDQQPGVPLAQAAKHHLGQPYSYDGSPDGETS